MADHVLLQFEQPRPTVFEPKTRQSNVHARKDDGELGHGRSLKLLQALASLC